MEGHSKEECRSSATGCCDRSLSETVAVRQTLSEMEFERGIWYAAQNNDHERVEKLLNRGISVDIQDGAGYTALHYAARGGYSNLCEFLLKNGANVDATTRSGRATSLHRSSMRGAHRVVELLLNHGADPNIRDSDGYTALHRAILTDSLAVTRLLMAVTDLAIRDEKSRTALDLAHEKNNPDIIEMFELLPDVP